MKRVLPSLFSTSKSSTSQKAAFTPRLEDLGDRVVPAVTSITQNLATGVATIVANGASDSITFTDAGSGGVVVTGGGLGAGGTTLNAAITKIELRSGGGDDRVVYNVTGNMARSIELDVRLGNGDDRFTLNQGGSDVLANVNQIVRVDGQSGADTIRINAAGTAANRVNIASSASMQLDLSGGGNFDLFDRGDLIDVNYRGEMDGTLRLRATGGAGRDTLDALLTLDAGSTGLVTGFNGEKATLAGQFGGDSIDFRVRNNGNAGVSAAANAGGLDFARDTVEHTVNVAAEGLVGDDADIVVV